MPCWKSHFEANDVNSGQSLSILRQTKYILIYVATLFLQVREILKSQRIWKKCFPGLGKSGNFDKSCKRSSKNTQGPGKSKILNDYLPFSIIPRIIQWSFVSNGRGDPGDMVVTLYFSLLCKHGYFQCCPGKI